MEKEIVAKSLARVLATLRDAINENLRPPEAKIFDRV
jgi:hypothetical protein